MKPTGCQVQSYDTLLGRDSPGASLEQAVSIRDHPTRTYNAVPTVSATTTATAINHFIRAV